MEIDFSKEMNEQKAIRQVRKERLTDSIVVRVIICCLVMDALIWGYFRFVKNVSVVDGIRGWQASVRNIMGTQGEPERIKRTITINKFYKENPSPTKSEQNSEINIQLAHSNTDSTKKSTAQEIQQIEMESQYIISNGEKLYCWKDDQDRIHYSNLGFPEGNIEKLWVKKAGN